MIALLPGLAMLGVVGLTAYAVVILALGWVCGVVYWTWRLARLLVGAAWGALVAIARLARFAPLGFLRIGGDIAPMLPPLEPAAGSGR